MSQLIFVTTFIDGGADVVIFVFGGKLNFNEKTITIMS